jgi:hypothetical protein
MSEDLPKLDLLIKIMRMTESESEGVTLVAISKANAMLKAEGWDWERLLRGKVRIIADPFAGGTNKVQPAPAPSFVQPRSAAPQPAVNPWPGGQAPKPKTRRSFNVPPTSPSPAASTPPQAPTGPLHFRKASNNQWAIASHIRIDHHIGLQKTVHKKDGSTTQEDLGHFIEQNSQGYYLYDIAKASKWQKRYSADTQTVKDLL